MGKTEKYGILAKTALLVATLIWGSTFVILKNAMDSIPPFFILSFRFLTATLILSAIFWKKLRLINKKYLWQGAVLGVFLAAAYGLQTIGLQNTTPGKNAFLTAVYCVLVPFMVWAVFRKKPDRYNFIAALTCIVGIGFVSLEGDFTIQFGDYMTLLSGIFYALHIVFVSGFNRDKDAVLLTIIQFCTAGVLCGVISLGSETVPQSIPADAWLEILYLAVFGTSVAMLLQNVGQKYMSSSAASIILSTEALFGALFSVIFYHEVLTAKLIIGFALIFFAVFVSETKLEFLHRRRKEPQNGNEQTADARTD